MSTPFYDLASVVVLPSGYKSGKIYAQKPLTTDGQLTFTRASTATRVNASGLIETVSSGVPRLDYTNSSCPKILLEPQRSNTITHSQNINSCFGSKSNVTVTSDATTSPDGTANADLLKFDTTNGYVLRGQTVAAATTYTMSVFVKNNNFTTGQILALNMSDGVIGGLTANINVAAKTATFGAAPAAYTNVSGKVEDYGNGWFRVSVTGTSVNGGGGWYEMAAAGVTNSVYVWGFSLEIGSYVTSYIPTTTAAVTRLADAASKTGISSLIGQTEGTLFVDIDPQDISGSGRYISIEAAGSIGNGWIGIFASGGTPNLIRFYGDGFDFSAGLAPRGVRTKAAFAYKNGVLTSAYVNGASVGTLTANTTGKSYANLVLSSAAIGNAGCANHFQTLVFKTALTNAQLAELTTL